MTEKEFKTELSKGIKEISEAISLDMEPIKKDVLIKMTNLTYQRILEAKLSTEINIYEITFKKILLGEIPFYKLNMLNLMTAFKSQQQLSTVYKPSPR